MSKKDKVTQFFKRQVSEGNLKSADVRPDEARAKSVIKEEIDRANANSSAEDDMQEYIDDYNKHIESEGISMTAEEEEEETFSLSFSEDGKIQVSQTEEKLFVNKDNTGFKEVEGWAPDNITFASTQKDSVDAKDIIDVVKDARRDYQNIMIDTLIIRIINDMIATTTEVYEASAEKLQLPGMPKSVGDDLDKALEAEYLKKKSELQQAIRYNQVHYEDIPEYIESELKERVQKTIREISEFSKF